MTVLRTLSYKLPEMLLSYVQTVAPTTQFGFPRTSWPKPLMRRAAEAHRKTPAEEPGTGLSSRADPFRVTPDFLRWLYHTSAYVPTAAAFNVLGIVGYNNEYPSPTDLMLFMKQFRADATFATYSVALVNGGAYNPNTPAEEPNLNIEYAEAISFPTRHIFYSSGNTWGDPALNWLHYLLSQQNVPQTISTSYGHPEYLVSLDYATLLCNLYAQLGLRGASVLAASGDDGVGKGNCQFKDSSGNLNVRFLPTFPSTCTCFLFPQSHYTFAGSPHWLRLGLRFHRSLGYQRRRNDGLPGGSGSYLWWWLLGLLSTASVPGRRRAPLPPEPRQPVLRLLQVRSLP